MSLRRLRRGEAVALVGALGLLVTMFLTWFAIEGPIGRAIDLEQTGWRSLGWFLDVLLVLSIIAGLAVAATTLLRQTPAWSVGSAVLASVLGSLVAVILLVRLLLQPDLGVGMPNDFVDVKPVAWVGFAFALLIPVGGFLAIDDERTDSPESAYTPPPARPVPGT